MSRDYQDYQASKSRTLEARRLIDLIDLRECNQKDYRFVSSVIKRLEFDSEIKEEMIYWLRDIKDRQL